MKLKDILKAKNIFSLISTLFFIASATILIFTAKGYIYNINGKKLEKTGMIVANSEPKGALLYLNDQLQNVTNTTLSNLIPENYHLKIQKEGYTSWEKDIKVEENVVIQIDARLFPMNPSLTPVTLYGCYNPQVNLDNTKIVFQVRDNEEKNGVWILSFNNLPFGKGYDLKQILKDTANIKYSQAESLWSQDGNELLVSIQNDNITENYIVTNDILSTSVTKSTKTKEEIIMKWKIEADSLTKDKISTLSLNTQGIIKDKTIFWSPDQNKFYYENRDGFVEVYDLEKETITTSTIKISDYQSVIWFIDSERFIFVENNEETKSGKLSITEIDGQNKVSVYEGILISKEVFVSPNGNKLFFLTNFNPSSSTSTNLYTLNLD